MQSIYTDSTYLDNNPTWHEEDAPLKAGKIWELWDKNQLPNSTVCEVGCGSGEVLVQLAKQWKETQFYGYDISPQAIDIAKKKETDQIKFELKDISKTTENFDILLVLDVIEHIENYFEFINTIRYKSKYTFFHIPLDMCLWSLFREGMLIANKKRIGHIHNFTEDFILSVLNDYGYKIVSKSYTPPSFKHTSAKQKISNFIRKVLFTLNKRFATKTIGGYSIMVLAENPVGKGE